MPREKKEKEGVHQRAKTRRKIRGRLLVVGGAGGRCGAWCCSIGHFAWLFGYLVDHGEGKKRERCTTIKNEEDGVQITKTQ